MTENEKAYRSAGRRRRARPLDLVHMRHVALDHLRGRSLVLMRSITLLAVALAVAFSSVPADAITPATPDGTGHPSVGILVAEWKTPGVKDRICSGTLIAPRIFLTSAHCDVSDVGVPPDQYWVSFDPVYQFEPPPCTRERSSPIRTSSTITTQVPPAATRTTSRSYASTSRPR